VRKRRYIVESDANLKVRAASGKRGIRGAESVITIGERGEKLSAVLKGVEGGYRKDSERRLS